MGEGKWGLGVRESGGGVGGVVGWWGGGVVGWWGRWGRWGGGVVGFTEALEPRRHFGGFSTCFGAIWREVHNFDMTGLEGEHPSSLHFKEPMDMNFKRYHQT